MNSGTDTARRDWSSIFRANPEGQSGIRFNLACATFALFWFALDGLFLPPAFGGTDIYYFKDAGINLAQGLGLVSRFTFGNPGFEYESYAQYPPLYPLIFGFFAKLFGASVVGNQAFNSAITVLVGCAGFLAVRPLFRRWTSTASIILCFASFALMAGLGIYGAELDRPDGLAAGIGILALVVTANARTRGRDFIAGSICALALMCSPFAGIWTSLAMTVVIMARAARRDSLAHGLHRLSSVAAGGLVGLLVAMLLIAACLPNWFSAFAGVLTGQKTNNETGGGYFIALLTGNIAGWMVAIPWGHPALKVTLAKLLVVLVPLAVAAACDVARRGKRFAGLGIVALMLFSPLSIVLTPYQIHYVAMSAALLAVAAACIAENMDEASFQIYAPAILCGVIGICLVSIPGQLREKVVRSATSESLARARAFIDQHIEEFKRGPGYIAVSPQTYMLWRERGVRPLIGTYSGIDVADNRRVIAYVALDYAGSSNPMEPHRPRWIDNGEYSLRYRPRLPQTVEFAGLWISRSSHTWESAIYARESLPSQ